MIDKKTASFMRSLCMGDIEEEILIPYPEPKVAREGDARGDLPDAQVDARRRARRSSAPGTAPARCRPPSSRS